MVTGNGDAGGVVLVDREGDLPEDRIDERGILAVSKNAVDA